MQRRTKINVRLAHNISHARAQCINRSMVNAFFNMYEQEEEVICILAVFL